MTLDFVFIMDPLDRIDIDADSTFVLMLEAQNRGHRVWYAPMSGLSQRGAEPFVAAHPVELRRTVSDHFELSGAEVLALDDFDAVFMRKDPPVDIDYILATYILDRVDISRVVMINSPQGVRDFNEKLAALRWPELMPPTIITSSSADIRAFIAQHGRAVVKPLLNAGGAGVLLLEEGDRNTASVIELLTMEGRRAIEVQGFVAAVQDGDKRVILLNGDPIGAVNRVPQAGDIRANMHVGGAARKIDVTDRDREIAEALRPELEARGLVFVGIDVIGGFLTEVNVTSPTGLQEINRFDGVRLEAQFIDWIERRRAELR